MSREDTSRQGRKPRPDAVPTPSRVCTIATPDYRQFIDELKSRVVAARLSPARAVNRDLVLLYWGIGVATYRLQSKPPSALKGKLPTARQLADAIRSELPPSIG